MIMVFILDVSWDHVLDHLTRFIACVFGLVWFELLFYLVRSLVEVSVQVALGCQCNPNTGTEHLTRQTSISEGWEHTCWMWSCLAVSSWEFVASASNPVTSWGFLASASNAAPMPMPMQSQWDRTWPGKHHPATSWGFLASGSRSPTIQSQVSQLWQVCSQSKLWGTLHCTERKLFWNEWSGDSSLYPPRISPCWCPRLFYPWHPHCNSCVYIEANCRPQPAAALILCTLHIETNCQCWFLRIFSPWHFSCIETNWRQRYW